MKPSPRAGRAADIMTSVEHRVRDESIPPGGRDSTLDGRMLYRRSATCLWRSFADEVLLWRSESDFRTLVGTAAHVWSLLNEPMSPREIAALLARVYRAPPAVITGDVVTLLRELKTLGYIDELSHG
jgi:hypothetical protein